jgi:hypothetical protein
MSKDKIDTVLFDAITTGEGIQYTLNKIVEATGVPILLLDKHWVVQYQAGFDQAPAVGMSLDLKEYADGGYLLRPIRKREDGPMGYLVANCVDDEELIMLMERVTCAIEYELDFNGKHSLHGFTRQEELLNGIFDGSLVSTKELSHFFQLNETQTFFIFVVGTPQDSIGPTYDLSGIMSRIAYEVCLIKDGRLVLLMCGELNDKNLYFTGRASLHELVNQLDVQGGISLPFKDITKAGLFYRQAVKAIEIGYMERPAERLHSYMQYADKDILDMCRAAKEKEAVHPNPIIITIKNEDENKGTRLYEELVCYILNGGNIQQCSEKLGIRWVTLKKHIEKIEKQLGADLTNPKLRALLYSYCLLSDTMTTD